MSRARRRRRGMTLIEVMIVIAIILMLTGALTWGLGSALAGARIDQTQLTLQRVASRVSLAEARTGRVPKALDAALGEPAPDDAWGHPVRLERSGDGWRIRSLGPDGVPSDDDLVSGGLMAPET